MDVLMKCVTPCGFRASAEQAGYPQVWGRDSVVTFLGAAASGEGELIAAGRASLETLGAYQSPLGLIPPNVNPDSGAISTENAGAVEAHVFEGAVGVPGAHDHQAGFRVRRIGEEHVAR